MESLFFAEKLKDEMYLEIWSFEMDYLKGWSYSHPSKRMKKIT